MDLRFWIFLRDVELGRNNNHDLTQLLCRIKMFVDDGMAICPICETVFVELMKQSDYETRMATAKLIDRLSSGVTLISSPERINQELCNAIYSQAGAKNLIPIDELVWTKLSYIFGEIHPHQTPFSSTDELVIQKAFFDHMWDISLAEMISSFNFEEWEQSDWQKTADSLNSGNKQYFDEIRSYEQTFRSEFVGVLNLFKETILQLVMEAESLGYMDFEVNYKILSDRERFTRFSKSVRTLHISASCHAAVRWDQKRQLKGNDLLDFHHAEAALGYCNLFLTEKPLKTLLSQNHLGLKYDFRCVVESSAAGGLEVLNANFNQE
ncbi:hypothetical protein [Flavobacterium sp.]|uniref:hypothetical protein n=1 Tax=Flavobacterium sp. TaxID=239 RepID=UPI00262E894A|nr:hypothetical protein [Flavobacterium sp.]